ERRTLARTEENGERTEAGQSVGRDSEPRASTEPGRGGAERHRAIDRRRGARHPPGRGQSAASAIASPEPESPARQGSAPEPESRDGGQPHATGPPGDRQPDGSEPAPGPPDRRDGEDGPRASPEIR